MTCRIPISGGAELRLLAEADAEELHQLIEANRAHIAAWLPWGAEQKFGDTLEFQGTQAQLERNDGFQVAIMIDGRIAGVIGYTGVSWEERSAGIGYWLAAKHQGHGTMSAAAEALTIHALSAWQLRRVTIRVATENARSRAIPERLGYREETIQPKAQRVGDRDLDLVVYAITEDEWKGQARTRSPAGT